MTLNIGNEVKKMVCNILMYETAIDVSLSIAITSQAFISSC